jgi:hypothetical protein
MQMERRQDMESQAISADFPYTPHFVDVHGSQIHYVEEGAGIPSSAWQSHLAVVVLRQTKKIED